MFLLPSDPVTALPRTGGIYALVEASTGRIYIGRAHNFYSRLRVHYLAARRAPKSRGGCSYLGRAMRSGKSQWFATIIEVLEEGSDFADREAYWVEFFGATTKGLGFNLAAPTPDVPASPELCEKLSRVLKGKKKSSEPAENIGKAKRGVKLGPMSALQKEAMRERMKARVGTPEFADNLAKLRAVNTGRVKTPEEIEKVAAAHRGKPLSAEHRAKLSAAKAGKKRGPRPREVVERVRAANLGKKRTPEQRAAMSASRKGVPLGPFTDEHRAKLAAAATGRPKGPMSDEHKEAICASLVGRKLTQQQKDKLRESFVGRKSSPHTEEHKQRIAEAIRRHRAAKKALAAQSSSDTVGQQ